MEQQTNEQIKTNVWLKRQFSQYYTKTDDFFMPKDMHKREYGFGTFTKKIAFRHRAFKNQDDFVRYIRKEVPAHVNYSTARYRFPEASMDEKERLGTDLIFDIDVGDLNLPCAKEHPKGWICDKCLEGLKNETMKLQDFLLEDFGFSEKELLVNFSGSRGYHIRIEDDSLLALDEDARTEIVKYMSAGMDMKEILVERDGRIYGPKPSQTGIPGRMARAVIGEVKKDNNIKDPEWIVGQIEQGNWGAFPKGYGMGRISAFAKRAGLSIPIDSKVTTDMTHLIRMPETLHGGSSLLAMLVDKLEVFEPFERCFVLDSEPVKIVITRQLPKITVKNQCFGPFEEGATELPKYLAAYLMAKGFAVVG